MATQTTCDRCNKIFQHNNERLLDIWRDKYPQLRGQDICPNCYLRIEIVESVAANATIEEISEKEYLEEWLKMYDDRV